jgi:acyl-coenzyme A synthetase/AMP-(fatty) acid ligase
MNAAELLLGGESGALALLEGDVRLSYGELRRRVVQAAAGWAQRGIRPGERCVIGLPDGADWVAAFLGLIWLGGIPIAISPRTEISLVRDLMADAGASAMLLEDDAAAATGDGRALGRSAWQQLLSSCRGEAPPHQAEEDAPAFWLYSSGTTGKPKGIIHAHRSVAHAHVFAREVLGATPQDRFYSTSKLFFAYPLANSLFAGLRLGASVVLDAEWPNPERVARIVEQQRPTLFFSVPTLYRRLVEARVPFVPLRRAVSAGEACPPDVAAGWQRLTGVPLVNGYGTTETLSLVLYRTDEMAGIHPTPLTQVSVDAEDGGRDGAVRLWFSHPGAALGYSREVTHDSARFGGKGFSPGDLFRPAGMGGADGWAFAGRSDQLLKVFGRWVDTIALEQTVAARLQGKVRESCIVPHGAESQDTIALHLFAVPGEGDETAVRAAIEEAVAGLPAYLRPQGIHLVGDMPRTETGKLRRGVLGKMLDQVPVRPAAEQAP